MIYQIIKSCHDCKECFYNYSSEEYECKILRQLEDSFYMIGFKNKVGYGPFVTYTENDQIPNECPKRKF